MLGSILLVLFVPCTGIIMVFIVYVCLLWYATNYQTQQQQLPAGKVIEPTGLSAVELEKLPKVKGEEMAAAGDRSECAVCLDVMEGEQLVRVVPGCNHGFHLECVDVWLSKHPACPVCRTKLQTHNFCSENLC